MPFHCFLALWLLKSADNLRRPRSREATLLDLTRDCTASGLGRGSGRAQSTPSLQLPPGSLGYSLQDPPHHHPNGSQTQIFILHVYQKLPLLFRGFPLKFQFLEIQSCSEFDTCPWSSPLSLCQKICRVCPQQWPSVGSKSGFSASCLRLPVGLAESLQVKVAAGISSPSGLLRCPKFLLPPQLFTAFREDF